jgi:hypothetical protein
MSGLTAAWSNSGSRRRRSERLEMGRRTKGSSLHFVALIFVIWMVLQQQDY